MRAVVLLLTISVCACSAAMPPLQQRGWDAFWDCRRVAPSARLVRVSAAGALHIEAPERERSAIAECLNERYGYVATP